MGAKSGVLLWTFTYLGPSFRLWRRENLEVGAGERNSESSA